MDYDILRARFEDYETVLRPDKDIAQWWAGAPSIAIGPNGTVYLAARMREGESPLGLRGYEVRILASEDGIDFETIARLPREDVPIDGFERPALVYDESRDMFRLYLCGPWPHRGVDTWCILRCDEVVDPGKFDPSTARPVLCAPPRENRDFGVRGYKDPFVWVDDDTYHMLAIGYTPERSYHFTSGDGDDWHRQGEGPWFDHGGWHTFCTRPACVIPMGAGWFFVYEGAHPEWHDPVYNIATGLAWTPNLVECVDLTPDHPLLKSTTTGTYHTWRYSHWLIRDGQLWAYAEVACPNDTNEIRLYRLPLS